jgi:hypothetical protein
MTQQVVTLSQYLLQLLQLLQLYALGLMLLQQNRKYKCVHILAHLLSLDIAVKPNGKSGCVTENSMANYKCRFTLPVH